MNYQIENNHRDRDATPVADDAENEIPVIKILSLAGFAHTIPDDFAHGRVGQATSPNHAQIEKRC